MAHTNPAESGVPYQDWLGRISDADPHDIPPGSAQSQDNMQSGSGEISVRGGVQKSSTLSGSDTDAIISLFGYVRPEGNIALSVDDNGVLKSRRSSVITSLETGKQKYSRHHFEKDRRGRVIILSGMERGVVWDGFASSPDLLGIDAPGTAPTFSGSATGGGASAGEYTAAYRYLDDRLPPNIYSSISTTATYTATALDTFTYSDLATSSQTRVKKVQIWRSAEGVGNYLYLIATIGHNGTITSSADNGSGNVRFTLPAGHNLVVGATIDVAGHVDGGASPLYVTEHEITAITSTTVDTDITYTADGTGGTWTVEGYVADTATDAALRSGAESDINTFLGIVNPNGSLNARKQVVPPNYKTVVKSFQDRFWYGVDLHYSEGTVSLTSGSATVTGSGTAFTSAFADRYLHAVGASKAYKISSSGSATSLTLDENAAESLSGVAYSIRPDPAYRNQLLFSEPNEPESVPSTNTITIQENTDDDDEITGIMPFGSAIYILKDRHIYVLSFVSQPKIDASVRLLADRGAFNQRCYDIHEGVAYLMDSDGIYIMRIGGGIEHKSDPIQDIFRDGTLDYTKSKWFHVKVDPISSYVYFFVAFTGDSGSYPTRAIVYDIRDDQFWTESYPDTIGDSAVMEISSRLTLLLGGDRDRVLLANQSGPDIVTSAVTGTATAGASTTLTDSAASFATFPVGTPIAIDGGTGKGQLRYISSNTGTVITVTAAWTTNPSTDSTYIVGAIEYKFKGGISRFPAKDMSHETAMELVFNPTASSNTVIMRYYLNHQTSATQQKIAHSAEVRGRVTTTVDSVDIDVDIKRTDSNGEERAGYAHIPFDTHVTEYMDGERWVTPEIAGFKGDDSIDLYSLIIKGAG